MHDSLDAALRTTHLFVLEFFAFFRACRSAIVSDFFSIYILPLFEIFAAAIYNHNWLLPPLGVYAFICVFLSFYYSNA